MILANAVSAIRNTQLQQLDSRQRKINASCCLPPKHQSTSPEHASVTANDELNAALPAHHVIDTDKCSEPGGGTMKANLDCADRMDTQTSIECLPANPQRQTGDRPVYPDIPPTRSDVLDL